MIFAQWYWEAKLLAPPDYLSFGWVTRDFRSNVGYYNLGSDPTVRSFTMLR